MDSSRKKRDSKTTAPLVYITKLYLIAMFFGLPLFPGLRGYVNTGKDAFVFFSVGSTIYLGVFALGTLELILTGCGQASGLLAPLKRLSGAKVCFLLYLMWSVLSSALSPYEGTWIGQGRYDGLCVNLLYVAVFWVVSSYGKWDGSFLWILGSVVILNGVIGLMQYAGGNPLGLFPDGTNYHDAFVIYNGQFMGTLGNVDILGAFLSLIIPLFYAAYLFEGKPAALLPMGAGAFLLSIVNVDAGYIGIAAAIFLTFPLYYSRSASWPRGIIAIGVLATTMGAGKLLYADRNTILHLYPGRLGLLLFLTGLFLTALGLLLNRRAWIGNLPLSRWLWLALPIGLLAGILVLYAFPFSSGTLWEIQQLLHGKVNRDFGSGRIRIWEEVLHLIGERPLLGGGPDTLIERMPFTFTRYLEELGITIEAHVDAAHNLFLNTAVNQGLPALGFLLAGIGFWLRDRLKQRNITGLLLTAGILGYLAQGCFSVGLCSVTGLFWIFLALGECDIMLKPD